MSDERDERDDELAEDRGPTNLEAADPGPSSTEGDPGPSNEGAADPGPSNLDELVSEETGPPPAPEPETEPVDPGPDLPADDDDEADDGT